MSAAVLWKGLCQLTKAMQFMQSEISLVSKEVQIKAIVILILRYSMVFYSYMLNNHIHVQYISIL